VLNVVYVDRSVAVIDVRSYGIVLEAGGRATLAGFMSVVGLPGAGSDFWMHPAVLARAPGLQLGNELRVLRMDYALRGRQYRVVRFQSSSASWNYEEETGILLRSTSTAQTTVLVPPPGTEGPITERPGGTIIAQNTLLEARPVSIPWAHAPAPSWLATSRRIRYDGTWTMYVPGSPITPLPLYTVFERQHFGGNWARYVQYVTMPNAPGLPPIQNTWSRVFGPAQIGGLWIPANFLAQLRPGQVLDRDQVTGVVVTVAGDVGGGIGISEANQIHRVDYVYDRRSGMMTHLRLSDGVLNTVLELRLTGIQ
jgi:hypothetical protein